MRIKFEELFYAVACTALVLYAAIMIITQFIPFVTYTLEVTR